MSLLGLGGHAIGTAKIESEAVGIVQEAVDAGVTFMDNAWEYHDGRFELYKTTNEFEGPPGREYHGFPTKGAQQA